MNWTTKEICKWCHIRGGYDRVSVFIDLQPTHMLQKCLFFIRTHKSHNFLFIKIGRSCKNHLRLAISDRSTLLQYFNTGKNSIRRIVHYENFLSICLYCPAMYGRILFLPCGMAQTQVSLFRRLRPFDRWFDVTFLMSVPLLQNEWKTLQNKHKSNNNQQ